MQLAAATPCSAPAPSVENNQLGQPSSSPGHFVKDGRVIEIGDCALFRSGDSPPFIGIILSFLQNYENAPDKTKSSKFLSVNWLYRPSDVKLSRGNLLEAAPNEVFYSFHKDIVPADSLLHPCKVSFLRKGIDLKNGVSSFVCRRVYDIEHKRLWWLTDKNYINERQAEVNKLLDRTQSEMNTSPQQGSSGNRQSKSSLKSPRTGHQTGQDDSNGFPSSFLSHSNSNKTGRKRDPLSVQPIKRDPDPFASAIEEDSNNKNDREISSVQSEISKITEMGGLTSIEAVEKLLNLMQSDRTERKLELTGRVKLAGIIAGSDPSDKNEGLLKFVQMRGVGILDEWLQEAHKGTKDDISNNNNNNKGIEELLLALLHALEKLPINLSALRMCNIGKSVNHLRGHKNVEVQKKARFLVDTWKRRVDAEMKANELKTGLVQLATSKSVHSKSGNEPDSHSPNSSSSFGSVKPGSANKITSNKTCATRPVTRSTDAGRLNMPLPAGSGGSSPVHQVQAGKMKKCEEKEELVGFEEDSSELCTGTGTTSVSVSVPAGDDLGMLASVAAEEMTKSEPKEEEMTNADAPAIAIVSNDNENDDIKNEGEKIEKDNNETDNIDKSNKNEKEELGSSEKVPESAEVKPKEEIEKANNIKQENKEKEQNSVPVSLTKSAKEENTEDPPKPENNNNPAGGTSVDTNEPNLPKQETKPMSADVAQGCVSTSVSRESVSKVEFDLNEGLEESPLNTDSDLGPKSTSNFAASLNPPFAPKFTVGPFLSQENLLRPIKSEMGRVGSGPISAFRPAEPRRGLEISIGLTGSKPVSDDVAKRPVLEFDLNVPDERLLEETMGSNGFELDLNRMDGDAGPSGPRGFDLNGPGLGMDEAGTGAGTSAENLISRNQFVPRGGLIGMAGGGNSSIPFLPQNSGLRMMNNNNSDPGHIWFPQSGTGPYQVSNPFGATSMYRLPGNNAVLYPGQQSQSQFPFGFPPGQTPYQSMVGAGLSLSQRPYFINLPEGSGNSNSGGSGQGKWVPVGRPGVGPGLDLNGPGSGVEYVVHVDQVLAGAGKRKEPEGGWDKDRDRDRFAGGAAGGNSSSNKQFWQ